MSVSKFTDENRIALLELISDGLSLRDACKQVDVGEKTVKGWLTRGRREEEGDYADFAAAVDHARDAVAEAEAPMDEEELRLVTSRAARKGSTQAMKLMWEMLRANRDPGGAADDPWSKLDGAEEDEIAERRRKKKAS